MFLDGRGTPASRKSVSMLLLLLIAEPSFAGFAGFFLSTIFLLHRWPMPSRATNDPAPMPAMVVTPRPPLGCSTITASSGDVEGGAVSSGDGGGEVS